MSATAATEVQPPPNDPTAPTEASARAGYDELVHLMMRRRKGPACPAHGGLAYMGDPRHPLLGLTLDTAAPVFLNPFGVRNAVVMVLGEVEDDARFVANLLAHRTRWAFGDAVTVDVASTGLRLVDHFPDRENPREWPSGRVGSGKWRPHAIILPDTNVENIGRHRPLYPVGKPPAEVPFQGVFLRYARVEDFPKGYLSPQVAEWLPKARTQSEAGYAEAVFPLPYGGYIPLAIVASTPEYEWLTSHRGGPAADAPADG
jgi:hypothetical protein